jgi:glycosyltransferase involved in cell wall biosynthesis
VSPGRGERIVYTTADASPQSGAFRQLLQMSRDIVDWGYQPVLVLAEEARDALETDAIDNAATHVLPLARVQRSRSLGDQGRFLARSSVSAYQLARIIRRERARLVHVNEILDVYGPTAARLAGVPCLCHLRADLSGAPSAVQALLPRMMAALSTEIVAVSASAEEHTFRSRGIATKKVSVLHNPGPNPSTFHPGVDGGPVRAELGLAGDALLIVLVAKLGRRKGHEVLIRAAPRVAASFPTARFLLVGGALEGAHHRSYAEELERLRAKLGVERSVTFLGYRRDVPAIMAAADVVAHCSTYPDPFPGVVLQGMAMAKAVVASDLGGPREQIENGVSGVLVRPDDPSALADAICALLESPEWRDSLGREAEFRVRSLFSAESFYRRLSEIYRRLIPLSA